MLYDGVPAHHFISMILVVKPITLRRPNLITVLDKNPVLDVGGKPRRSISRENPLHSDRD